uniref:lateral signaling target protein 2 homolog n=1 Tax=Erigeron canadensis TaxID=72917 RepID=UPI001CB94BA8|nr:lateral signaling target protein 2 homolog [Erigeron canadensis]
MPTFTTIALENLLQHRNPTKNPSTLKTPSPIPPLEKSSESDSKKDEQKKEKNKLNHIYISPALYTTPEPTPILLETSFPASSVSPSPYVFNRKGRGARSGTESVSSVNKRIDGFEVSQESGVIVDDDDDDVGQDDDDDDVEEEFEDPRCDSVSVASSNDCGNMSFVSSNHAGEFYDATEEFSSDGSMLSLPSWSRNLESELHTTRLSLLEEVDKRKTAEDDLAAMSTHWQTFSRLLLPETGLAFLAPSNDGSRMQVDFNAVKQFSEEVIVARYIDEAMGKAEAKAEAELAADVIIGSKDKEISRLKDRLQYYEAMIHEMSQKNLETMEVARRQRERKRGQRKWLWSCIGMSIVIGASVIAYSYVPQPTNTVDDTQPEAGLDS